MSNKPSDTEMQSVPKANSGQNQQNSKQAQQNAKQAEQAQQNAQQATQAVEKNTQAETKAAEQQADIGEQEADKFVRGKGDESDDSGEFHRDSDKSSDDDGKFNKKEEKDEDAFEKSKDDKDKKKGEGGEDDDSQPFKKSGDKEKGLGGKLKDAASKEDDDPVAKASNQNPDAGPNAGKQGGDSKASSGDEGEEKDDKNNPAKKMAEKVKKKAKKKATSTATGTLGRMFILGKIAAALKAFLAMFVNALAAIAQALFGWLFNLIMFVKGLVNAVLGFLGGIISGIGSFFGGIVSGIAGFFGISSIAAGISFFGTCIALLTGTVAAVVSSNEDNAIKERDMTYASPTCAEQAYNAVYTAMEGDDGTFDLQGLENMKQFTSVMYEWAYKGLGDDKATILIAGMMGNCLSECCGQMDPSTIECGFEWNGETLNYLEEKYVPGEKKTKIIANLDSYAEVCANLPGHSTTSYVGDDGKYYCHTGIFSATGPVGYYYHTFCKDNNLVWYSMDANLAWFLWENDKSGRRNDLNFKDWCYKTSPDTRLISVDFSQSDSLVHATNVFYSQWEAGNGSTEKTASESRQNYAEKALPYIQEWINGGDLDSAYAQSIIGMANSSASDASNDTVTDMMGDCSGFQAKYNNANLASAALSMSYFDDNEEDIMNGNPTYNVESGGIGFTQAEIDDGDNDGDSQAVYDANATKFHQGCTKTYIDVLIGCGDENDTYWSSCDRGVAASLKWSGAFSDVSWGNAETVGNNCRDNPEQFDYFEWDGKGESLEPGDIVYDGGHIWMYVGTGVAGGLVEAKWHDRVSPDVHYICHSSFGGRGIKTGTIGNYANGTGDHRWFDSDRGVWVDDHWHVVRCKKYEENPKYVHCLDEQGAQEDVNDQQNGKAETEN